MFPDEDARGDLAVLVPGTGLSRLHYDIARMGFQSHGVEFSYYMLLPAYYLLNCVERKEQWNIYPWVHASSNVRASVDRVTPIKVRLVFPKPHRRAKCHFII